ncbi:hypothetical protein BDZ97DRAFT_1757198 [Flammula alnicola]|nr:hypothetical protein BDZ97DRAFT_1757198 [Flammula alnicola]
MDCPSSSVDDMATINHTAPKSTTANASDNADKGKGKATAAVKLRLPSFEEATGLIDSWCLPSYREMRNTIYDEEHVELNVPPACHGGQLTVPSLIYIQKVPHLEGEELQLDETLL